MPANTTTCPGCHAQLKARTPFPAGKRVQCPRCGNHFLTSDPSSEWQVLSTNVSSPLVSQDRESDSRPVYKSLVLAISAVLLLVAGIAGLAFYSLSNEKGPPAKIAEATPAVHAPKSDENAEQEKLAKEKNRHAFIDLMVKGGIALGENRFQDAEKSYEAAAKLFPDDVEAASGLGKARAALAARSKTQEDEDKRKQEFAQMLAGGRDAMTKRHFAAAVRSYEGALQLVPGNIEAVKALGEAKEALAADLTEQAKLAEFDKHMAAGKAAMVGQRYKDALTEFIAAQRAMPDAPEAANARRDAEKRLEDVQEVGKRREEFARLLKKGADALRAQRFDEAVRAYKSALTLKPKDAEATRGLRDAQKALTNSRTEFARLMTLGDYAMLSQSYVDAVWAYNQASRLYPGSDEAILLLRNAEALMDNLRVQQLTYDRLMLSSGNAMRAQRYADALQGYQQLLRLYPNDLDAAQGFRDAKLAFDQQAKKQADYTRLLQAGANAFAARKYAEAVQYFSDALKILPNDSTATNALNQAKRMIR